MARGPQPQQRPAHIGRRRRQFGPVTYSDPGKSFEQAMEEAYVAYGQEQKRLIDTYRPTEPPTEPPPTQPPAGDIPLPPGVGDVIFDDPMTTFDQARWCRQVGDPKWGLWPGGLPDVNWNDPDNSISGMGPWSNNWEYFHPDQVSWGPDGCTLTTVRDGKYADYGYEYRGAIIRSKVVPKNGGFFRAVCQMAKGKGAWDGCWMICDDGSAWEPDLIETGFIPYAEGADADTSAATTFHYAGGTGGPEGSKQNQARYNAGDMVTRFRTWDCLYKQGVGTTYWLDGVQTHHVPDGHVCGFAVMLNNSVASPIAADWHDQVEDERQDFVMKIKRVLLCEVT